MRRLPGHVPDLAAGPFTVVEAEQAGLTRDQLQAPSFRRLHRGVYVLARRPASKLRAIQALARRLPQEIVFAGATAAWLHGVELDLGSRIEITVPAGAGIRSSREILVRHGPMEPPDTEMRYGLRVTTKVRTAYDLARNLDLVEAVAATDHLMYRELCSCAELSEFIARRAGSHRVKRARRVISLVEPLTESLMESRLRMLLVLGGLPRPQVQADLFSREGAAIGRADIFFKSARLVIEYDGASHRERISADARRQNLILQAGYGLLRYTATDVYQRPDAVVGEVTRALAAAAA